MLIQLDYNLIDIIFFVRKGDEELNTKNTDS